MPNKKLLVIAVFLCFAVALERIYNGYVELIPAINEGECAIILRNPQEVYVKVLENRMKDATAFTSLMDAKGNPLGTLTFNFRDLRNIIKEKIECPK